MFVLHLWLFANKIYCVRSRKIAQLRRMMKPLRSLLFVPGHRGTWVEKAIAAGVDGLLLDIEDSVPEDLKQQAREEVARSITRVRESGSDIPIYVRVNALETGMSGDDIEAV